MQPPPPKPMKDLASGSAAKASHARRKLLNAKDATDKETPEDEELNLEDNIRPDQDSFYSKNKKWLKLQVRSNKQKIVLTNHPSPNPKTMLWQESEHLHDAFATCAG